MKKSLLDNPYLLRASGAIAVIALLAVVGTAWPSMDRTPSAEAMLQDSATPTAIVLPSPAECQIPPREVDKAMAIIGPAIENESSLWTPAPIETTPGGVSITERNPVSLEVASTPWIVDGQFLDVEVGAPPPSEVEQAVRDTIRQYAACQNAGDTARLIALLSDQYLARFVTFGDRDAEAWRNLLESAPQPLPEDGVKFAKSALKVRQLPEGRVGAIVANVSRLPGPEEEFLYVGTSLWLFVEERGRWVLDETVSELQLPEPTPTPVTPTPDPATVPVNPSECDGEQGNRGAALVVVIAALENPPATPSPVDRQEPSAGTPSATVGGGAPPTDEDHGFGDDFGTPKPGVEAELQQTIREIVACQNGGDLVRFLALISDQYLAQFAIEQGADIDTWQKWVTADPSPMPEGSWKLAPVVVEVHQLPDGRLAAVVTDGSVDPGAGIDQPPNSQILVFAYERGRWLLDEEVDDFSALRTATPTGGTPVDAAPTSVGELATPEA